MPSVFGSASVPFIGCITLLAASIMTILAFASPYWGVKTVPQDEAARVVVFQNALSSSVDMSQSYSFGLWRRATCRPGTTGPDRQDCARWDWPWYGGDWQYATRGLESLAIIFFAIPLIILPVYIYVALGLYYRCLMGCTALSVLLGTLCNIAGVVVFGIQVSTDDTLSWDWCLIVCIVGGGLGLIAFIILLIATINKPEFVPEKYFMSGFYVEADRNRLYVVETDEPIKVVYPASEVVAAGYPQQEPLPEAHVITQPPEQPIGQPGVQAYPQPIAQPIVVPPPEEYQGSPGYDDPAVLMSESRNEPAQGYVNPAMQPED